MQGSCFISTMWRRMRHVPHGVLAVLAVICLGAVGVVPPALAIPPQRVVSINLCTDQLAMLMAGPGQLHSVSFLAREEGTSMLIDEARRYPGNHGQAEEVFLMRPDLVLAGTYTARASVALLKRLGFQVEQFPPANDFDDIRQHIARIGELLGREQRAAELIAQLDAGLAELAALPASDKVAVSYSSNSYVTGSGTLSDSVMKAAGVENMAAKRGIVGGARVPLEMLLAAQPDLVVTGTTAYDRPALAQENFSHPAFVAFAGKANRQVSVPDRYWICGAPFTLTAARLLRDAADAAE